MIIGAPHGAQHNPAYRFAQNFYGKHEALTGKVWEVKG